MKIKALDLRINKPVPVCKNCGKCCYIMLKGKQTFITCDFLIVNRNTFKTRCLIYDIPDRLTSIIKVIDNYKVKCVSRVDSPYDYPGCPFNTNKPIVGEEITVKSLKVSV